MPPDQLSFGWDLDPDPDPDPRPKPGQAIPITAPLAGIAPLADRLRQLAARGIYLGTSSWKYPGWLRQVYNPACYQTRGRFSQKAFERGCLAEYATVFPTVGGDFSFYQFPSEAAWEQIFSQLPDGFRFSLKVPEEITVARFPKLARYGSRRGRENPSFLDAALLGDKLLAVLEPYRSKLGAVMLEFGTFHAGPLAEPASFAEELGVFLSKLPTDRFDFCVEVRNRDFLYSGGGYLSCLKEHGVAHCLNSWARMPALAEQLTVPGTLAVRHVVARLLLRPGRGYQEAVDRFAPYERVQEIYPEGRSALAELIERCLANQQTLFAFVNNRFEGNAPGTIQAVVEGIELD